MVTNPPLVDWSELASDLLSLVYNRLSFADFARARTVCSSWYTVPKPRKNHVPWLIFKQDRDWKLFDPEEDTIYITQFSRLGFADCSTLATCGNWVLVRDRTCLYIINPFTLEIINDLPPLQSHGKYLDYCPIYLNYGSGQSRTVQVEHAVLWVDERTKDYFVAWTSMSYTDRLCFCMKGDEEWIKTRGHEYLREDDERVEHMVYKDKKLYILSDYGSIKILDFSQDFLREVPINHPCVGPRFRFGITRIDNKMRLTTSGDILIIQRVYRYREKIQFEVYKMNSTNEEWEIVDSFDEAEALVWDLCDYYWDVFDDYWDFCADSKSSFFKDGTYEILKQGIERLRVLRGVSDDRWLLPCVGFEE